MAYTRITWGEAKSRANVKNHGIRFDVAATLFEHSHLVRLDTREDYGEDRWVAVGLIGHVVAVVVFTDTVDDEGVRTIRIISARKATLSERITYEKKTGH